MEQAARFGARLSAERMAMLKAIRVLLLAGALSVSACATPRFLMEAENARTNTHVALAFEETVFNRHRVREGFSRYVASTTASMTPSCPRVSTAAPKRSMCRSPDRWPIPI
jgi:hypothetical protein